VHVGHLSVLREQLPDVVFVARNERFPQ
jgi:hypothetical protein